MRTPHTCWVLLGRLGQHVWPGSVVDGYHSGDSRRVNPAPDARQEMVAVWLPLVYKLFQIIPTGYDLSLLHPNCSAEASLAARPGFLSNQIHP